MRRFRVVAAAAVLAVLAAGCGKDNKVGDESLLDFKERDQGRIGEVTTTQPTTATTAPTTTAPPTSAVATTRPPATTATTRAAGFTVKIVSGGQGFDPFNFVVRKGTRLQIVNTDSQARTWTSDQPGVFDSGPIAPGATFTYVANQSGKFNFHDETRPFAVGQMEVQG